MKQILSILVVSLVFQASLFGQIAPNFTITDSNNNTHRLYEDYLNQGTTVVIDIFFVNCPPCADIAPFTQKLYEEWGEGEFDVQFIELSNKSGDSNAEVSNWKEQLGTTYPGAGFDGGALTALDPYLDGTFGTFYGVPTFVVIAPDRTVNYGVTGSGISGKIEALNNAIIATGAVGEGEEIMPSNFEFNFIDAFGNPVNDVNLTIASEDQIGSSYDLVAANGDILSILNIDDQFPGVNNPTFHFSKVEENVSNKISTIDIIKILKHIIGVETITNNDLLIAADANNDGSISSIDLITLQKIVLGIILNYPNGNNHWQALPSSIPFDLLPNQTQQIDVKLIRIGDLNDF